MNTTEFLSLAAAIVPERAALIFEGRRFSFGELQERVQRLANAMADIGVGPGDRVATMQVNGNQGIELYFAAALLDAIYTPLNFRAKAEELAQMLAIAGPRALFIGERYLPLLEGADLPADLEVVVMDGAAGPGQRGYDDLLEYPRGGKAFPGGGWGGYDGDNVHRRDYGGAQGGAVEPRQLWVLSAGECDAGGSGFVGDEFADGAAVSHSGAASGVGGDIRGADAGGDAAV